MLRGYDAIAIMEEQSVPEGNVLINERSTSQGVRKSRFHCKSIDSIQTLLKILH